MLIHSRSLLAKQSSEVQLLLLLEPEGLCEKRFESVRPPQLWKKRSTNAIEQKPEKSFSLIDEYSVKKEFFFSFIFFLGFGF